MTRAPSRTGPITKKVLHKVNGVAKRKRRRRSVADCIRAHIIAGAVLDHNLVAGREGSTRNKDDKIDLVAQVRCKRAPVNHAGGHAKHHEPRIRRFANARLIDARAGV